MTAKQEMTAHGGNTTRWVKSGHDLWKLKTQQPHLFARPQDESPSALARPVPTGFKETSTPGWLQNAERQVFLEAATQKLFWLDREAGVHRELHQGENLNECLSVASAAVAVGGSSASSSTPSSAAVGSSTASSPSVATPAAQGQQARHVVIMDFHKAAEAFKIDLEHIDRPAAMLAVYGNAAGAAPAELVARTLHEKLLRRLGANRSQWSVKALQAELADALGAAAAEAAAGESPRVVAAVALQLGGRLVAAAAGGASCLVADPSVQGPSRVLASLGREDGEVDVSSVDLSTVASVPCALLLTEAIGRDTEAAALLQAARGRPRAASIALLRDARAERSAAPLPSAAAAGARFLWTTAAGSLAEASAGSAAGPAPKRRRTESADERVRCRRILLKYAGCKHAVDTVRRKPVRRSLHQAEAALFDVLVEVDTGGDAAFAKQCRAVSECSSSLKGGDLIGDVGWWTKPVEKPGEKISRDVASRNAVVRAALQLEIGELSDLLISDEGVQILQRRA
eukprot:TRINITY_DN24011_c0_g1_i1.p1 TRINITY_DN24011_c0_g1~~TRINITY_DN24011_c0_g1_i1.p1  ORF type:complete len:580 (+),score=123.31 TRINITY_DN24011_c0_g1_i1:199-1740(+)